MSTECSFAGGQRLQDPAIGTRLSRPRASIGATPHSPLAGGADTDGVLDSRRSPWFVFLGLVLAALPLGGLVWLNVAIEHRTHPPTCYGIGWGCRLDAVTTATVVIVVVYGPVLLGVAAILGLLELGGPRLRKARSVVSLVAAAAVALAAVALIMEILTEGWAGP